MDAKVVGKEKSPIMLSHHVYWALHGYNGTQSILGHTLHLPVAEKYIETDPILVPTGLLPSVQDTPYDFRKPSTFASLFNDTEGVCGSGCQGWDSCFVLSEHNEDQSILTLTSPESGIQMDVKTNQDAVQIYTCNGISGAAGSIPRKRAHGGDGTLDKIYENYSCVVIEMEDYSECLAEEK
jgi:aldose 1-epimerase